MYNKLKSYNKDLYSGMTVGGSHLWNYNDGKWFEIKEAPDKWRIKFDCVKTRDKSAPLNSGAKIGTSFHWYIIADQIATKLNKDSYMTVMNGIKIKIGHKRPQWKTFTYEYPNQAGYKEKIIEILENLLKKIKNE